MIDKLDNALEILIGNILEDYDRMLPSRNALEKLVHLVLDWKEGEGVRQGGIQLRNHLGPA